MVERGTRQRFRKCPSCFGGKIHLEKESAKGMKGEKAKAKVPKISKFFGGKIRNLEKEKMKEVRARKISKFFGGKKVRF